MKFEDKFLLFIFVLLGFTLGLSVAKLYHNLPLVSFDGSISIVDLASLFVTSFIAVIIPLYLKKFVDDNRGVKRLIELEILDIIKTLFEIKDILANSYKIDTFSPEDKDKINYIFHTADLQIVSLQYQLEISFGPKSDDLISKIKEKYFEYNEKLTGGLFMTPKFNRVTDGFRKLHDTELNRLATFLKSSIHKIHRY